MTRMRLTIRGEGTELRGYATMEALVSLTSEPGKQPYIVAASVADDDYDPFAISDPEHPPTPEKSREVIQMQMDDFGVENEGLRERLTQLHYGQALVIRGERHLRQMIEADSLRRELHHFEAEQMSEKYLAGLREAEKRPTWDQIGDILQTPPDGLSGEEYRRQVIELMQKERGE